LAYLALGQRRPEQRRVGIKAAISSSEFTLKARRNRLVKRDRQKSAEKVFFDTTHSPIRQTN